MLWASAELAKEREPLPEELGLLLKLLHPFASSCAFGDAAIDFVALAGELAVDEVCV